MAENWYYERVDENSDIKRAPMNDYDGTITGRIVINVPAWLDENPEEAHRLGFIKHITHDQNEVEYDKQSQFLTRSTRVIDEWTVEDVYHVMNKSEEMMLLEELGMLPSFGAGTIVWGGM